jgi:signal transduction histidine kinase
MEMKSKTLTILISILISFNLTGQIINLKQCDSIKRFPITQYISLLKTTKHLSIESIVDSSGSFRQAPNKTVLVMNYDPFLYWFRIILQNTDNSDKNVMLLMAPIGMREGKLFQKKEKSWNQLHETGLKFPYVARPFPFMHNIFPVTIEAGRTDTLYLYADANGSYKSFGFALLKPKDLQILQTRTYFVFGIIVGLLMLFCVLNISLHFFLKVRIHLWYALYIICLFLIVMKNDHLDQQFLGWDSEFLYQLTPYMAIGAIALSILSHVVQLFFISVIPRGSKLYKFFFWVKMNALFGGILHFFLFYYRFDYTFLLIGFNWAKYSSLLASAAIIVQCIYCIGRGYKSAYFILGGLLVFLVGACQRLFFPSTLTFLFPPTLLHVGIIMETVIITVGLVYQYYWIEKEADRQRENQFKLELHKTELEIQQQTMRNISLEIHDNVGQLLSLAKLNLMTMECNGQIKLTSRIYDCTNLIGTAIQDLRNLARTLNHDFGNELNLNKLIQRELSNLEKIGVHDIHFIETGSPFEPRHRQFLFRIFQECINNIVKHAEATRIEVVLEYDVEGFSMIVSDNGIGFEPESLSNDENIGMGIRNMKERAHMIGGLIEVESRPNEGTRISTFVSADQAVPV